MKVENVTIVKKANVYYDGQVTSRTLLLPDGSTRTLGIMTPGEYSFETDKKEKKEITFGDFEVLFEGEKNWKKFKAGDVLFIPANSITKYRIHKVTDYFL